VEIDLSRVCSLQAGDGLAGSLNLKLARLASALLEISVRLFSDCVRLEHMNLHEGDRRESIGRGASKSCLRLSSVSIPPSCRHIGLGGTWARALRSSNAHPRDLPVFLRRAGVKELDTRALPIDYALPPIDHASGCGGSSDRPFLSAQNHGQLCHDGW
jgi:hypothetical protein